MRIFKYIFKNKLVVLIIICLLIAQAFCELSLPNYTSNIVDVGIQQGGVENVSTTDLSKKTHDYVGLLLDLEDENTFLESYT